MSVDELVATGVCCSRGGRMILDGFGMRARSGEMVAVTGPSGSGKSTLLMLLAGIEPPDAGDITLDGAPVAPGPDVGVVLQSYGLLSLLTASENVEVALQAQGLPASEVRSRSARVLTEVGLAHHAGHLVDGLSGGQQQRVAIARAVVTQPRLLLVDEPTAELDRDNHALVMRVIDDARRSGAIVVVASHDPQVAAQCTRVISLTTPRYDGAELG